MRSRSFFALRHLFTCVLVLAFLPLATSAQRRGQPNAQRSASGTESTPPADGAPSTTTTPAPRGRAGRSAPAGGNATFNAAALAGNYVATTTGVSGGRASAAADGFIRNSNGGQSSGQLKGTQLLINIDHFLSESEQAQLEQAAQNNQLTSVLSKFNCGSLTIGDSTKPIPINAAISAQSANGTVIYLLSEQAFAQAGAQGRSGAAGAVGMIEMRLAPAGTSGKGSLYTTAQVGFNNGAVIVRGGASTATQLTIAKR